MTLMNVTPNLTFQILFDPKMANDVDKLRATLFNIFRENNGAPN